MSRLAWAQLRFRATRTFALLAGLLVAATAFTVLTAASRTEQLRTVGTVTASYRPSYDILVRPKGTQTALEKKSGTVQPNFLAGIYGGITLAQWRQIERIQGVQVAAPIAMVGYTFVVVGTSANMPASAYAGTGRELYRYTTTWVSEGGTSRVVQPPSYLYVTPNRVPFDAQTGQATEILPGGSTVLACPAYLAGRAPKDPFGFAAQSVDQCWSRRGGGSPNGQVQAYWQFPMLIAAIDPDAEAALDGLNKAVVSGHYLKEDAGDGTIDIPGAMGNPYPSFPVLATTTSGFGEQAVTQITRLASPPGPVTLTDGLMARDATAPGQAVSTVTSTAQQAYQEALGQLGKFEVNSYFTVGPVSYQPGPAGRLTPVPVTNPASDWVMPEDGGLQPPPMDQAGNQYRKLRRHETATTQNQVAFPLPTLAGTFSPARIQAFNPLSQLPLGAYQPVTATPGDAATSRALGGASLLPNLNLGGYITQPVQLITTLSALPVLDSANFGNDLPATDPISVIRVRVAGVTGPNAISRARINQVAQQIAVQTGLTVDIVAGSSPQPVTISLPAGKFGQPKLNLVLDWVKKGVAVAILSAVDRQSVLLFALILAVCVLFVGNAATAAVRGRRQELGVLACLGWRRSRLFGVVLGEIAVIGVVAGLLSAAISVPVSAAAGLSASPGRALLAVPAAVLVAVAAGAVPAWLAARAVPAAAVRPAVLGGGRGPHPRGITTLALLNVARTPGRTLVGVASLAVGIGALTVLTAVTVAFRGVVVGSLLGNAIALQVRGVDYVAITATVLLGVLAVADVLFLNIRERAPELATIRSLGWRESALARLVISEGAVIGLLGSLAGAGLGLAATAWFAGQVTHRMIAVAVAAAAAGIVITVAAAFIPAALLRRLPASHLLAEE